MLAFITGVEWIGAAPLIGITSFAFAVTVVSRIRQSVPDGTLDYARANLTYRECQYILAVAGAATMLYPKSVADMACNAPLALARSLGPSFDKVTAEIESGVTYYDGEKGEWSRVTATTCHQRTNERTRNGKKLASQKQLGQAGRGRGRGGEGGCEGERGRRRPS